MKSFKDLRDLKTLATMSTTKAPATTLFDLDEEDPELDLNTWRLLKTSTYATRENALQPNEMSLRLQTSSAWRKKNNIHPDAVIEAQQMYFRFGAKLLKQLRWTKEMSVEVFQHPQDKTVYGIMPKQIGSKIKAETSADKIFYLQFGWSNPDKLLTCKSIIVEHAIHENGYLLFRLPPQVKE